MGGEVAIIWVFALGLGLACVLGYLAQRLKLSPIFGYLLAGYFIGPNFPGYTADKAISDQLASIGVTLLMFAVGLSFNWTELYAVKKVVVPGAALLSSLSIVAGICLGLWLENSFTTGFVLGVAICVSSTVVIVRVLVDQHVLRSKQGYLVMGWTIVEDLVSVFGLILLPSVVAASAAGATSFGTISYSIMIVLVKIAVLGLVVYFIGERLVEIILKVIARTRSHELFTLAILSCVFLIALATSSVFGISLALGAFIAGTAVGKTELSHQAAANALPMRDTFSVIFFLSVGMLFNPAAILHNLPLFLGILVILLLARPLIAFLIVKIAQYPSYVALTVALAISQIGEYSFILAEEANRLKALPENVYDMIVACSFITIALNPILFQLFHSWLQPRKPEYRPDVVDKAWSILYEPESSESAFLPQAMVIGYGPVGKAAAHCLSEKFRVRVIDQNIDTVANHKEENIEMLFGDATQLQLLERANVGNVHLMVITTPDVQITDSIIEAAQHANPKVEIIGRVHFRSDFNRTRFGEITMVCDEEEAAKKMVAVIRKKMEKSKN